MPPKFSAGQVPLELEASNRQKETFVFHVPRQVKGLDSYARKF